MFLVGAAAWGDRQGRCSGSGEGGVMGVAEEEMSAIVRRGKEGCVAESEMSPRVGWSEDG